VNRTLSPPATRRVRFSRSRLREGLSGYVFILPAVAIITVFGLFPILYAIYMSAHAWRVRRGAVLWLGNFEQLIGSWPGFGLLALGLGLIFFALWLPGRLHAPTATPTTQRPYRLLALALFVLALFCIGFGWDLMRAAGDNRFLRSIEVTLYYALGTIPAQIVLGLLIAYVLFQNLKGQEWFRMIFFLPYIVPVVVAATVFSRLFSARETSFANTVATSLGLPVQRWLQEPTPVLELLTGLSVDGFWAGPSLALVVAIVFGIWNYTGFCVILYLAGLGNIPKELYEAAEIDGANRWAAFRNITVPLLSNVTFYLSVISFIGVLQVFNTIYVLRTPQALGSMDVVGIVIFDTFYLRNQYGLAAAQALLLFLLILYVTLIQYRVLGRRVHRG
jgi:multiple sugar transport system permease protein